MMRMVKIVKEKEETILEMAQTSEDTVALRTELMAKASLAIQLFRDFRDLNLYFGEVLSNIFLKYS